MAISFDAEYMVLRDTVEQLKSIAADINEENQDILYGDDSPNEIEIDCRRKEIVKIAKRLRLVADSIDNQGERK